MDPEDIGENIYEDEPGAGGPAEAAEQAAPEQPVWTGPSPDEWQATIGTLGALAQYAPVLDQLAGLMAGGGAQADPYADVPDLDPFDEQSVQAHIDARVNALVDQRVGPLEQVVAYQNIQTGQQIAEHTLAQLEGQYGKFNHAHAQAMAAALTSMGGYDPRQALMIAAHGQAQYEAEIRREERAAAQAELTGQLENVAGAPNELGVRGTASGEVVKLPTGDGWGKRFGRMSAAGGGSTY